MWITLIVLASAAPVQAPASAPTANAWVLGYTGYVTRACGDWQQRTDVIPMADMPAPDTLRGRWGENGSMTLAYRSGLAAARTAKAEDVRFCEHPARRAAPHEALAGRVLIRSTARSVDRPSATTAGADRD